MLQRAAMFPAGKLEIGLEPTTPSLRVKCSTAELIRPEAPKRALWDCKYLKKFFLLQKNGEKIRTILHFDAKTVDEDVSRAFFRGEDEAIGGRCEVRLAVGKGAACPC